VWVTWVITYPQQQQLQAVAVVVVEEMLRVHFGANRGLKPAVPVDTPRINRRWEARHPRHTKELSPPRVQHPHRLHHPIPYTGTPAVEFSRLQLLQRMQRRHQALGTAPLLNMSTPLRSPKL